MPVQKNHPEVEVNLKDWIGPIVAELDEAPGSGDEGAPVIIEDYLAFSDNFSVRVVWQKWEGISPEDRVPVILQAYSRSKRASEVQKITHVLGLTPKENEAQSLADKLRGLDWTFGRSGSVYRID